MADKKTTIIAVASQKGGVGKTTLAANLAGALTENHENRRVLLVDIDAQGNLSSAFLQNIYGIKTTIANVLSEERPPVSEAILRVNDSGIWLLPANLSLSNLDTRLAGDTDAQFYLSDALAEVRESFDFIIIDCPPNLGLATRMALVAADTVLIPIECQEWAKQGAAQLESFVGRIAKRANPNLTIAGFVLNKVDSRRSIEMVFRETIRSTERWRVLESEISPSVKFVEASAARMTIFQWAPKSTAAAQIRLVAREALSHVK